MSAPNASLGIWVDGVEGAAVPADDRGLAYGDGVFETVLVRNGVARFLDAHIARLSRGCARLGIPFDVAGVQPDLGAALARAPSLAILKIVVTRGSAPRRGYAPSASDARRVVSLWTTGDTSALAAGVDLGIARTRAAINPAVAGLKHLNRLDNVLAAAEITADAFDVVMLDANDDVVSGSACNLFVVQGRRLATPRLDRAGVAGVMRAIVLRESPKLGLITEERALTLAELRGADGMFVTNARIGVVPVRRVGEHAFRMNDIALALRAHLEALDA
ncbi:MAG TPA: aminodeoxychorismate lyase [Steroidobacteraceae bacterium]|nr:aminodeoxychorismate lyase [Steroidobacteraceae bacterium]